MTYEQTREQFLLAWNSNAYIGMCTSDDMKNAIEALEKISNVKNVIEDLEHKLKIFVELSYTSKDECCKNKFNAMADVFGECIYKIKKAIN